MESRTRLLSFRPRQKVFQPEGRIKASLGYTRFASLWFRVDGLGLEYPNSRLAQGFSLQGVLLLLPLRLLRPRRRRLIFWLGREAAMSVSWACSALFTPNPATHHFSRCCPANAAIELSHLLRIAHLPLHEACALPRANPTNSTGLIRGCHCARRRRRGSPKHEQVSCVCSLWSRRARAPGQATHGCVYMQGALSCWACPTCYRL